MGYYFIDHTFYAEYPLELGVVPANALENAIHACMEVNAGERKVGLIFRFFGDRLIFQVTNPSVGEIPFDENGVPIAMQEGMEMGAGVLQEQSPFQSPYFFHVVLMIPTYMPWNAFPSMKPNPKILIQTTKSQNPKSSISPNESPLEKNYVQ